MRKFVLYAALFAFCSSLYAQDMSTTTTQRRRGEAAGYASRDATIFSVMGWGFLLAAGIAAVIILIPNDTSGGHSH